MPKPEFTVAELAALLGVARATVRRWIATGQLRAVRVGGRWRIPNEPAVERQAISALASLQVDCERVLKPVIQGALKRAEDSYMEYASKEFWNDMNVDLEEP